MKKLNFLPLLSIMAISVSVHAQKIEWGSEQKNESKRDIHEIIGYDANGFYVTRYKCADYHAKDAIDQYAVTLEKYDFACHRLFSKDLMTGFDKYNFNGLFYMKNGMVMIMYSPDNKTEYAMKVNADGTVDNNKVAIGTMENQVRVIATSFFMSNEDHEMHNGEITPYNRYLFFLSSDKSTLLACYHKDKENKISISALGDTPKVLWSKEITTAIPDADFEIVNGAVTNNTVYILARLGRNKNQGEGLESEKLFVYDHGSDASKLVEISPGPGKKILTRKQIKAIGILWEQKIGDLNMPSDNMTTDNMGNVVLVSFYATKESDKHGAGMFIFSADKTGKVLVSNAVPFTKDFLTKFISDKKADKGEGISLLDISKVIITADNSIIVAADQWLHSTVGGVESFEFHDAIIAKLKSDGSVTWIKNFPKKQEMTSHSVIVPYVCSYGISVTGNTINVIYNDHKKNDGLNQDDIDKDRSVLKASYIDGGPSYIAVILESIDIATGDSKRITLYNAEKQKTKLTLYSTLSLQTEPNKIVVYRGDDDMDQFGQFIAN